MRQLTAVPRGSSVPPGAQREAANSAEQQQQTAPSNSATDEMLSPTPQLAHRSSLRNRLFCPLKSGASESRGSRARPPENTRDTEHIHVRRTRDTERKLERKKRPYHQQSPRPKQVNVLKRGKGRPRQPARLHTP